MRWVCGVYQASLWIIRGAGSVHCMLEGWVREGGSLRIIRGGGSVQAMIQGQSTPCYGWANLSFNHHYGWASLSNRQETDDTEWQNFVCVWQDIQPPLWLSGFIIIYLSNYHMPLVVCTINPFDMFCTWCIGNQWKTKLYIYLYHIYILTSISLYTYFTL